MVGLDEVDLTGQRAAGAGYARYCSEWSVWHLFQDLRT